MVYATNSNRYRPTAVGKPILKYYKLKRLLGQIANFICKGRGLGPQASLLQIRHCMLVCFTYLTNKQSIYTINKKTDKECVKKRNILSFDYIIKQPLIGVGIKAINK